MREITMKVYNFDELSEGVKTKVIEDYRELLAALRNQDLIKEYLQSILEDDYNLKDFEVDYSLSYSQGDGVCFYGNNVLSYTILKNGDYNNANAFEKYVLDNYKGEEFEVILSYLNEDNSIDIEKVFFQYSHLNTCEIRYELFDCVYNDSVDKIIQNLCDNLKIYVYNPICKELERLGYSFIEIDDEEVIEFIEDNKYEFFENGENYVG